MDQSIDIDRITALQQQHQRDIAAQAAASKTTIRANGLTITAWEIGADYRLDVKPDNSATTLHFSYLDEAARDKALLQLQEPPVDAEATEC
jgi:hypothetical protein